MTTYSTLTIALTGELAKNHNEICEFISKFHGLTCSEIKISLLLVTSHTDGRLIPLLSSFANKGVTFNQVVRVVDEALVNIVKVMSPDIIMTTNIAFSEQCKAAKLACVILDEQQSKRKLGDSFHFAFDGDAVLFCHNAQLVANNHGIAAFDNHEQQHSDVPMERGRLFSFIKKIDKLQTINNAIKWSLVTARGGKALKRAMNTIESWELSPAQCFFMEGRDKTPILNAIDSDFFFDDHPEHCQRASGNMLVGHVQVSFE